MALSVFADRSKKPSPAALTAALGRKAPQWDHAIEQIAGRIGPVTTEWGFSSKSTGWGLRVKRGDRIIAYLTPCDGHFLASFALGRAAVAEARAARLPQHVLDAVDSAQKYAEGTGLRFAVSTAADVRAVAAVAAIKNQN
ncbi:MAG: DUF3788 family protein [Vicinamibacterales bacterium]|jgi:hypothetical protein